MRSRFRSLKGGLPKIGFDRFVFVFGTHTPVLNMPSKTTAGGGNSIFFVYFHPRILGEDEPILTNIFQTGWFNHQQRTHPCPPNKTCPAKLGVATQIFVIFTRIWGQDSHDPKPGGGFPEMTLFDKKKAGRLKRRPFAICRPVSWFQDFMAYSVFPFKITPGQPLPQVGMGLRWLGCGEVGFGWQNSRRKA